MFNEMVGASLPYVLCCSLDGRSGYQRADAQRSFLVDAPDGTGKTLFASAVQLYIRSRGPNVVTVASSAAAAHHLDGGRMSHSALKIPIPFHFQRTCSITVNFTLAEGNCNKYFFTWNENVIKH